MEPVHDGGADDEAVCLLDTLAGTGFGRFKKV